MRVLSIGEVLWDVFPGYEILGGAPLNFAVNSARLGSSVALLSATGPDHRGRLIRDAVSAFGVNAAYIKEVPEHTTGVAMVSKTPAGEPCFSIPRPAAFDCIHLSAPELQDLSETVKPDWLYFGTLVQVNSATEDTTHELVRRNPDARCFYDMNLRPGSWSLPLVERLSAAASVLKLNEDEAQTLGHLIGMEPGPMFLNEFCERWAREFAIATICVTLGPVGCMIFQDGAMHTIPGFPAEVADTVGAGDAFAAAFLYGHHHGWPVAEAGRFGNAVGSIVASRSGATPIWSMEEGLTLAEIRQTKVIEQIQGMEPHA